MNQQPSEDQRRHSAAISVDARDDGIAAGDGGGGDGDGGGGDGGGGSGGGGDTTGWWG